MGQISRLVFEDEKPIIGVVHLDPLPGSPNYDGDFEKIIDKAIRDARTYYEGGIKYILVENYGDMPFKVRVKEVETIVAMTVVVRDIIKELGDEIIVGVNLLRNSAPEAAVIATLTGARFIRVNALCQTIDAPEGILYPVARDIADVMYRLRVSPNDVKILADVNVKHGSPLSKRSLEDVVLDTIERGKAYAIVMTGSRTGEPPDISLVSKVKSMNVRVFIGSGMTPERLKKYWRLADGFIIGTYFKKSHITRNPVDIENVRKMVRIYEELLKTEA
ncbi:MAG: BtpA-like protein [Thermoprotei archaeon]|nr:MAG: BtpA-like protein [Thermoprotei archaeon]RLF19791.1 MAG: BtpA-like protein [Thermoprotei archaeon]